MKRDLSERLTELEIQLSHLQRLYEQLDEVVTSQSMEAERMQRRLLELQDQVKQVKEKPERPIDPLDETPPHY